MASLLAQVSAVTAMNVKNVPSRWGASLVIVIGIGGVVGVLVALLSMSRGFEATLASTGRPDRAVLLRGGANDELSGIIMRNQVDVVRQAPGVKKDAQGQPMAVPEVFLLSGVPRRGGGAPSNVVVRGTEARVLEVRPEIHIVEGRMFTPGVREIVVGRGAQKQFDHLNLGDDAAIRNGEWKVVGVFESGGDVHESEILADLETLMSASHRPVPTSMVVQLESADAFGPFKDALTGDPRMQVKVQREPEYYSSRSEQLSAFINGLGYTVGVIMAIGALFGALNSMYAAVATRTTEIGTLRAIGFGSSAVMISVLLEALLLALLGGCIGAGISYVVFNGYKVSTLNMQTFSQVAFAFRVTPDLLVQGVIWACFIGLIGGFFPALKAIRLPVVDALRAQ